MQRQRLVDLRAAGPGGIERGHRLLEDHAHLAAAQPAQPARVHAQELGPEARFHFGPLALQPRFKVTNVGLDSNVLTSSANPMQDFTATFVPEIDHALPVRRARLAGRTTVSFVYFQTMVEQRSIDLSQEERLSLQLTHVTPRADIAYMVDQSHNLKGKIEAMIQTVVTAQELWLKAALIDREKGTQGNRIFYLATPPELRRSDRVVAAGVAVELVHMATLVHDDIIDGADLRRGRPTAWSVYGKDAARAAGDYLFARAFAELSRCGDADAVQLLAGASLALARGP
jgi:hypothetical protein